MGIMPFGCKAFAVKPKSPLSPRHAWVHAPGRVSRGPRLPQPVLAPPKCRRSSHCHLNCPESRMPISQHDIRTADHVVGAASRSRRALLLLPGPFQRPDGIFAFSIPGRHGVRHHRDTHRA
eukprot:6186968-Pleurochrysis_carterae.AAC.11